MIGFGRSIGPLGRSRAAAGLGTATYRDLILSRGPVALWGLGDMSGIVATDEMGTYNGTYLPNSGGVWTGGTLGQTGLTTSGSAAIFDGTSGYVDVGNNAALNPTGAASYEVWMRPTIVSGSARFALARDQLGQRAYGIGTNNSRVYFSINGGTTFNTGTILSPNTTYHVVAAGDPTNGWIIYLNGASIGSVAWLAPNAATGSTTIGKRLYSGFEQWFSGTLNYAAIYNRALTATEILENYNKGIGL